MITINLFTSGKHTQPLIEALKKAPNIKLVNIYKKLPDLSAEALAKADPPDLPAGRQSLPDIPDLFIIADFGQIIPKKILEIPKYGSLCLHPSLLPKYRGASPVQFAIINGEKETGVTIIKMDERVDHGPIIAQFKEEIKPDDTSESLYERLFAAGGQVLVTILPAWVEGRIKPRKQDHKQATYTKTLKREGGFIPGKDLRAAMEGKSLAKAKEIKRKIRAFRPWPSTWTKIQLTTHNSQLTTKRLKLLQAHLESPQIPNTKYQILVLDKVQLEGKKPVTWKQFKEGYPEAKLSLPSSTS